MTKIIRIRFLSLWLFFTAFLYDLSLESSPAHFLITIFFFFPLKIFLNFNFIQKCKLDANYIRMYNGRRKQTKNIWCFYVFVKTMKQKTIIVRLLEASIFLNEILQQKILRITKTKWLCNGSWTKSAGNNPTIFPYCLIQLFIQKICILLRFKICMHNIHYLFVIWWHPSHLKLNKCNLICSLSSDPFQPLSNCK